MKTKIIKALKLDGELSYLISSFFPFVCFSDIFLRIFGERPQITTTKLVALGLTYPAISVPRNRERTWPGSLAHVIQGRSSLMLIMFDQSE